MVTSVSPPPASNSRAADVASLAAATVGSGYSATLGAPSAFAAPHVRETLLVLSDVHLGNDINDRADPEHAPKRSKRIDADLIDLIRHYTRTAASAKEGSAKEMGGETRGAGERWRIVIAGDFIDFIGMSMSADEDTELATALSEEERAHGLGNAHDHARMKLHRVAVRHSEVFASLAAFVANGNMMTLVHGNHDIEFHWEGVKTDFKEILFRHAERQERAAGRTIDEARFKGSIEFNPWFFYVGGVAYIEHGHQYDAFCATDYMMAPLSPFDPKRIARNFSDTLLRFVVRSTRGMKEHGHEGMGMVDYIAFAVGLGFRGLVGLGMNFARAIVELFRLRRAGLSDAARLLREEHERRMTLLAEATRIGIDRMRALAALQVPPVTRSISGILASVLLDRLALAFASIILLLVVAVIGIHHGHFLWAGLSVVLAWWLGHRHLAQKRKIDPDDALLDRAAQLARLFPAAFVVMGHTHVPMRVPLNDGDATARSTYINVGSWAEEEADDPSHAYRAARTHLVIRPSEMSDGKEVAPVAEFLMWSPEGPRSFVGPWKPMQSERAKAQANDTTPSDPAV